MNTNEFREEVYRYLDRAFDEFAGYKNIVMDVYDVFKKICDGNDIPFYVAYGSLLGAVRDGGMIPWDYDFDVQMPITFKERLVDALERDLPEDYYYCSPEKTDRYPHSLFRICRRGYDSEEFHVDVFFLIGAPDDEKTQKKLRRSVRKVFKERLYKYRDLSKEKAQSKLMYVFKLIQNHLYGICPKWLLDIRLKKLCKKYSFDSAKYYVVISEGAGIYPSSMFSATRRTDVDGSEYILPEDADRMLNVVYGDYMSYPAIEARFSEFYDSYLRAFRSLKRDTE